MIFIVCAKHFAMTRLENRFKMLVQDLAMCNAHTILLYIISIFIENIDMK